MEQLSIRDWMIIFGGVMIAAVLVDAGRRYYRERRSEIRLNARIERAAPLKDDDDAFNLLTELPNGGARIVQRGDLQRVDSAEGVESLAPGLEPEIAAARSGDQRVAEAAERQTPSSPEPEPEPEPEPKPGLDMPPERAFSALSDESDQSIEMAGMTAREPREVPEQSVPKTGAAPEKSGRRRTVKPAASSEPVPDVLMEEAEGTMDWLEDLEPEEVEDADHGRLPRGANTHVFILYVTARAEEGFFGTEILEVLLSCDLRFGDMDFFHRHERPSGRGPIQFSVANMMKPGVFDIDNMEPLQTRGLMFFVTLPGPSDMLKAFDHMYETAKVAAKLLDGDIQDETRSVVTRQSLEHMRQQIRELERRLMIRRT